MWNKTGEIFLQKQVFFLQEHWSPSQGCRQQARWISFWTRLWKRTVWVIAFGSIQCTSLKSIQIETFLPFHMILAYITFPPWQHVRTEGSSKTGVISGASDLLFICRHKQRGRKLLTGVDWKPSVFFLFFFFILWLQNWQVHVWKIS